MFSSNVKVIVFNNIIIIKSLKILILRVYIKIVFLKTIS
jgi:hypothetical protein